MLKKINPDHKLYNVVMSQKSRVDSLILGNKPNPTWNEIRRTRDTLLKMSDWTQAPDSPLSQEKRAEWAAYRQSLRDLPETTDLASIVWPQEPN